jgi:hypothetical protein
MRVMLQGVVEGNPLLKVLSGWGKLSAMERGLSQCPVSFEEERWVSLTLGHAEELLSQLVCRRVLCPYDIKPKQSVQRWEELRGLPHLLTQF